MKKIFLVGSLSAGILVLLAGLGFNLLTSISRSGSDSMEPTLPVGSWTYTNSFEEPELGDMISFYCNPEYMSLDKCEDGFDGLIVPIVHRFTAIDDSGCMTIVGDNPKYQARWDSMSCYKQNEIHIQGVSRKLPF